MYNQNKKIFFSKMHGLGNDFVIIEKIYQQFHLSTNIIKKLSNRNTGIGFDQLLIVEKSNNKKFDFYYKIFNADGSEVAQCGNGARCFAYFVYFKKITNKKNIFVKTNTSIMNIKILNKNNIIVNMGYPQFNIQNIPVFNIKNFFLQSIKFDNKKIVFSKIFIGNPHCIIIINEINSYLIKKIGNFFNKNHVYFPDGVNVNFMKIISPKKIILRVYERGVGETKACGSGACASVISGIIQKFLSSSVTVQLPGGNLEITWKGFGHNVYMNGPVEYIYDGYFYINH